MSEKNIKSEDTSERSENETDEQKETPLANQPSKFRYFLLFNF
jgi:hypothetical protein